jgi:hypothetical protein
VRKILLELDQSAVSGSRIGGARLAVLHHFDQLLQLNDALVEFLVLLPGHLQVLLQHVDYLQLLGQQLVRFVGFRPELGVLLDVLLSRREVSHDLAHLQALLLELGLEVPEFLVAFDLGAEDVPFTGQGGDLGVEFRDSQPVFVLNLGDLGVSLGVLLLEELELLVEVGDFVFKFLVLDFVGVAFGGLEGLNLDLAL